MANLKDLQQNLLSADEKRKVLKELDLFVLDNSMRETTIGQLRGHTLENKWEIFDEVNKLTEFLHKVKFQRNLLSFINFHIVCTLFLCNIDV